MAARKRRRKQFFQTLPGGAHADELAPGTHRLLHRGKSPGHDDRSTDHRTGGHLFLQHQQGTETEHRKLQHQTGEFRGRGQQGAVIGRLRLQGQGRIAFPEPAAQQSRCHAHGIDRFGIPCRRTGHRRRLARQLPGGVQGTPGREFIEQGQGKKQHRPDHRHPAQQRMQHGNRQQIYRHPGRIEQGVHRRAGEKGPHGSQILQCLHRL